MIKKIFVIICLFLLTGCTSMYYINNMSFSDIINLNIQQKNKLYNVNNKGYKYYLPQGFTVYSDKDYNQILLSNSKKYYLYVDLVSYYYKTEINTEYSSDDYFHYALSNDDTFGYLKITENNDNFFVELCYNYAIIDVEVEEYELRYAISRGISILNSIKYNDLVIQEALEKYDLQEGETLYNVPKPENKTDSDNVLEYIEEQEKIDNESDE